MVVSGMKMKEFFRGFSLLHLAPVAVTFAENAIRGGVVRILLCWTELHMRLPSVMLRIAFLVAAGERGRERTL